MDLNEKKVASFCGAGQCQFFLCVHLYAGFFNWCLGNRIHQTHRYQGRHGDFIDGLGKFHAPTLLVAFSPVSPRYRKPDGKYSCND